jgi:hypothetical protein
MAWSAWALPASVDPHRAPAGYRAIPAQDVGGRREENAPVLGQPRDAQAIIDGVGIAPCSQRSHAKWTKTRLRTQEGRHVGSPRFLEDLKKWVRKNITPATAHIRDDTLTAGRLAEECLWEARGQNLSEDEVIDAAGGNLLTFVVSELNRAADQKIGRRGE